MNSMNKNILGVTALLLILNNAIIAQENVQPYFVTEQDLEPIAIDPGLQFAAQPTTQEVPRATKGKPLLLDKESWFLEAIKIDIMFDPTHIPKPEDPSKKKPTRKQKDGTSKKPLAWTWEDVCEFIIKDGDDDSDIAKMLHNAPLGISRSDYRVAIQRKILEKRLSLLTFKEKKDFIQKGLSLYEKHQIANGLSTRFFDLKAQDPFYIPKHIPCVAQLDMFVLTLDFLYKETKDSEKDREEYNKYGEIFKRGLGVAKIVDFINQMSNIANPAQLLQSKDYHFIKDHSCSQLQDNFFIDSFLSYKTYRMATIIRPFINNKRLNRRLPKTKES